VGTHVESWYKNFNLPRIAGRSSMGGEELCREIDGASETTQTTYAWVAAPRVSKAAAAALYCTMVVAGNKLLLSVAFSSRRNEAKRSLAPKKWRK
jgi:hypothetical protein